MRMNNIKNELLEKHNECIKLGLNISWRSLLEICYEVASKRKQYQRCHLIQDLIIEDINL